MTGICMMELPLSEIEGVPGIKGLALYGGDPLRP